MTDKSNDYFERRATLLGIAKIICESIDDDIPHQISMIAGEIEKERGDENKGAINTAP